VNENMGTKTIIKLFYVISKNLNVDIFQPK